MVSEVRGQCRWINGPIIVIGEWIRLFSVTVSEQIVHLRTPKETTVGKVIDCCIKMLGVTEDKSLFIMTETRGTKTARRTAQPRSWTQQHVWSSFACRISRDASIWSADWESAEIRSQTTGAALVQNSETDHLTFMLNLPGVTWPKTTNTVFFFLLFFWNPGEANKHCFPRWTTGEGFWAEQQQCS